MTKRTFISLLILPFLATLSACGPTAQNIRDYDFAFDIHGLKPVKDVYPTQLYVREGAPELSNYTSFIVNPVVITNSPDLPKADAERAASYLRSAVESRLEAQGYKLNKRVGGDSTLEVSFTLSGIESPNSAPNIIGLVAPISPSVGEVTIEAAFINSGMKRIDAVVVERTRGSRLFNATPWSTWADIEATFDQWAEGFVFSLLKSKTSK